MLWGTAKVLMPKKFTIKKVLQNKPHTHTHTNWREITQEAKGSGEKNSEEEDRSSHQRNQVGFWTCCRCGGSWMSAQTHRHWTLCLKVVMLMSMFPEEAVFLLCSWWKVSSLYTSRLTSYEKEFCLYLEPKPWRLLSDCIIPGWVERNQTKTIKKISRPLAHFYGNTYNDIIRYL